MKQFSADCCSPQYFNTLAIVMQYAKIDPSCPSGTFAHITA